MRSHRGVVRIVDHLEPRRERGRRPRGHRIDTAHVGALPVQTLGQRHGRGATHVVGPGLERQPQERDDLALEVPDRLLDLAEDRDQRCVVHAGGLAQQPEVIAQSVGHPRERDDVLGQAVPTVAESGAEERGADARVGAHDLGHPAHVGIGQLTDAREGVGERDLRREERVGRQLGELGRSGVGLDQAAVLEHRGVELAQHLEPARVVAADDETVRPQRVLDGVPLPKELRVGHGDQVEVRAFEPDHFRDASRRARRHRRLDDEHHPRLGGPGDRARRLLDRRQALVAVALRRASDADEHDARASHGVGDAGGESEPVLPKPLEEQSIEVRFVEGCLPLTEHRHRVG